MSSSRALSSTRSTDKGWCTLCDCFSRTQKYCKTDHLIYGIKMLHKVHRTPPPHTHTHTSLRWWTHTCVYAASFKMGLHLIRHLLITSTARQYTPALFLMCAHEIFINTKYHFPPSFSRLFIWLIFESAIDKDTLSSYIMMRSYKCSNKFSI